MQKLAIITARGGSKRIPNKNIKDFRGKPIIAYSIEAAIQSRLFDEVMVSTDSRQIAEIAEQYGANIPFFRSEKTSNDFATTADVLNEVLTEYERLGREYGVICCIYPTAPFVTADKLKQGYELLVSSGADEVIPVIRFSFPPQRGYIIRDGKLAWQYPEYKNTRSQDLEPIYQECGQFYFYRTEKFRNKTIETMVPMIMREEETQDIDQPSDWKMAELKYMLAHGSIDADEE